MDVIKTLELWNIVLVAQPVLSECAMKLYGYGVIHAWAFFSSKPLKSNKPTAADTVNRWKTYVSLPIDHKNERLQIAMLKGTGNSKHTIGRMFRSYTDGLKTNEDSDQYINFFGLIALI